MRRLYKLRVFCQRQLSRVRGMNIRWFTAEGSLLRCRPDRTPPFTQTSISGSELTRRAPTAAEDGVTKC